MMHVPRVDILCLFHLRLGEYSDRFGRFGTMIATLPRVLPALRSLDNKS